MLSDQADQAIKTGHPRLWVAGLVLLLLVLGVLTTLRDDQSTVTPPKAEESTSAAPTQTRDSKAAVLFVELAEALASGTRREAVSLAFPGDKGAAQTLGFIHDNVNEIGFRELSFRYIDEATGASATAANGTLGRDGWFVEVQVRWRIAGFDRGQSQMNVAFHIAEYGKGAAFVAVSQYGERAPLWLLDDLAVARGRRALVMVANKTERQRYLKLADRAARDVRRVLHDWRGKLVIEVPESQQQLARMVAADRDEYSAIAALTSIVDGSADPSSPAHILVNPRVFRRLGDDGAQIVMSHEATHVATGAATSSTPMWLLEGFADYVALAHGELPVSVTASQILAQVRAEGPPGSLPGDRQFDPKKSELGATYEAAWLACRYLADQFGRMKLIAFYDAIDGGASTGEAFQRVLGTTKPRFTRGWQRYLERLSF